MPIGNWQHWNWRHFHIGNIKQRCTAIAAALIACSLAGGALADAGIAFPGAAGWGRFAKGARASSAPSVYRVTNLNDSGSGSLRDAVSRPNRVAVPSVPATIRAIDYDRRPACRPVIEKGSLSRVKRGDSFDYTVNVPEAGDYRVSVVYRSASRLELALAADGGRYKSKVLPSSDEYRKSAIGVRRLEAGAVVIKIGVVNASGARLRSIIVEK